MGEVKVTQVFNNYGSGAIIANNDGVLVINSGDKAKTKIDTMPVQTDNKSQCAKCKHGKVIMSGPHEGSGIYIKCMRPKKAVVISGGNIKCDGFVKNDK